jgi:large subunit ribosomal protein L17
MITLGKKGGLHAMRLAAAYIRDKKIVTKLFTTIAPRYQERPGGYTRIIKLGLRSGDNASLSQIELVEGPVEKKAPKKPTAKKTAAKLSPALEVKKAKITPKAEEVIAVSAVAPAETVEIAEVPKTVVKEGDDTCEAKAD